MAGDETSDMTSDVTSSVGRRPNTDERELWQRAAAVAAHAHAPYSRFAVGAALRGPGAHVHVGVNVENASYPAGMCAERVALGAFVTAGERDLRVMAVAAADGRDALPCGLCLQALSEFGNPDVIAQVGGELRVLRLHDLLAAPFTL